MPKRSNHDLHLDRQDERQCRLRTHLRARTRAPFPAVAVLTLVLQIPGRGEPIRLLFEETGTPYRDIAKEKDGAYAFLEIIKPEYKPSGA